MGNRFEIQAWLPGQHNGIGRERYGNVTIWRGDSRIRCFAAFTAALLKPNHPPLTLIWR